MVLRGQAEQQPRLPHALARPRSRGPQCHNTSGPLIVGAEGRLAILLILLPPLTRHRSYLRACRMQPCITIITSCSQRAWSASGISPPPIARSGGRGGGGSAHQQMQWGEAVHTNKDNKKDTAHKAGNGESTSHTAGKGLQKNGGKALQTGML